MTEPGANLIELFRLNHKPDDRQMIDHTRKFLEEKIRNDIINQQALKAIVK